MTASFFSPGIRLDDPRMCCVARSHPPRYHGRCYPDLAPTWVMIDRYKHDHDEAAYRGYYSAIVLRHLSPSRVLAELGSDAVLLCWEKPGGFCHRRLVAEWLGATLGLDVPEWTQEVRRVHAPGA